jgi:hypothetical protein
VRKAIAAALLSLVLGTGAGQGAPSGPGGTLLVYDAVSRPFSMEDEIEPVAILLSRFDPAVRRCEAKAVKPGDLESATRIVIVGTGGMPELDPACRSILKSTKKPVMAVGAASSLAAGGIDAPRARPEGLGGCEIRYHGSRWPARVDPWFPVQVDSSRVLAAVLSGERDLPLAFRDENRFGFSALPADPPLSMVFSDVLMDFYGAGDSPAASLLFVVDDFHPGCDAGALRRLVDYFSHLGLPFAVGAQAQRVPEGVELMPEEEFFETLRYARARGGRIFMQGAEAMEASRKFREAGLEPVGMADSAASDPAAIQIGRIFIRRIPGSDPVPFFLHTPLRLAKGGWLWPANVRGGLDGEHLDAVRSQVRRIVSFRGGVAGVVVPAWLPFQSMRDLVDAGRSTGVPVVDPLESVPKNF